jgi:hypothetical protein
LVFNFSPIVFWPVVGFFVSTSLDHLRCFWYREFFLLKCKADGEWRSFFPRVTERDAGWPTELKSIILHGPKGGGQESYLSMAIPMMWSRASSPSPPQNFFSCLSSFLLPLVDMLARNALLEVRASVIFFQVPYLLACLLTYLQTPLTCT